MYVFNVPFISFHYVKILYFAPFSQILDYLYALPFVEERLVPHPFKTKLKQCVIYKDYY